MAINRSLTFGVIAQMNFGNYLCFMIQRQVQQYFRMRRIQNRKNTRVLIKPVENKLKLDRPQDCLLKKQTKEMKKTQKQSVFPTIALCKAIEEEKNNRETQETLKKVNSNSSSLGVPCVSNRRLNRPYSFSRGTSKIESRRQERSKSYVNQQQNPQNIHQIKLTQQLSSEIFQSLSKNVVFTMKAGMVSIKKEPFINMLSSLVELILGQSTQEKEPKWLLGINSKLKEISKLNAISSKVQKSKLCSKLVIKTVNPYYLKGEFNKETIKMTSLIQKRQQLQVQVKNLDEKHQYLMNICQERQNETKQCQRRAYEIKQQLIQDSKTLQTLKVDVINFKAELERIQEKGEKIRTFVQSKESSPLMQYVGSQYKKLQEQMMSYAGDLHWDPLFSSLHYEPIPFRAIEKDMEEDLKWGIIDLEQKDKPIEPKIKHMVDLVRSFYKRFNLKDQQMTRITSLKTECIKKFIRMMGKWTQNHEIKKDTLMDLRKSFVMEAENIEKQLDELLYDKTLGHVQKVVEKLKHSWKKIEKHYKMGNYFY